MELLEALENKILVGDGCWQWTGAINEKGYGKVRCDGRTRRAHRVVYELLVGPIPHGLQLDHLCRNRGCVRPDHLEPVTCKENNHRGVNPRTAQTHCKRNHEFTAENTGLYLGKYRWCRTCDRLRKGRS